MPYIVTIEGPDGRKASLMVGSFLLLSSEKPGDFTALRALGSADVKPLATRFLPIPLQTFGELAR